MSPIEASAKLFHIQETENPERWLTQRFLKPGTWLRGQPNILRMVPNFTLDADEAVCNISFSAGQVPSPQNQLHSAVVVNGTCTMPDPWMQTVFGRPSDDGRISRPL